MQILGTRTADEWQHIFRGCGFVTGIPNQIIPDNAEASDQDSFIARGIPAVQIFTGPHVDYHRPGDTVDKIDGPGLVKVATFLKEALTFMLAREAPLTVRIDTGRDAAGVGHEGLPDGKSEARSGATPATHGGDRRVSVGTVPDFAFQGPGVRIDGVVPGSPAEAAGLQPGDILVELAGQPIENLRSYSNVLKTLSPDQQVAAKLRRGSEHVTVQITVRAR